jgi:uncharacterized membrane protein
MGNGLCTQSVVISDSLAIHIDAPAETVWGAILDFHEWPEFLSHVKALESQDGSMKVGTRFKEIRIYEGKEFFCNNTVTDIGKDPLFIAIAASHTDAPFVKNVENTSTLTVLPSDNTSCEVMGSFAYQPGGIRGRLQGIFCFKCLSEGGKMVASEELDDFKAEAEKRYRNQKRDSSCKR